MMLKLLILLCLIGSGITDQGIELRLFLLSDNTDKHYYIEDEYECGHFSRDLVANGSGIGTILVGTYPALNGTLNHAMCYCLINGEVVVIEPQSDRIMGLEDIDSKYKYYKLFPFGYMVPSTWDYEMKSEIIP